MSLDGNFTSLQLNALSEISVDRGFTINPVTSALQGVWTPSSYTQGSITTNTALQFLTDAIPNIYNMANIGQINVSTWRLLLTLGSTVCPALGNTIPSTFKPSYPGYGSWQGSTLASDNYPPKNYPNSGQYSYIYNTYGNYAYVTGWPGRNSWQKDTDTYTAAYLPTDDITLTDYDEYFSSGFISLLARQAYYELWNGNFDQYNDIVNSFSQTDSYRQQQNDQISSLSDSKKFMSGNFSNINDLTTNDLAGVTQAFRIWGNDLINTGKVIDLSNIHRFGTPSVLLLTLQKYGAITPAVSLALQYAGLNTQELNNIFNPAYVPKPVEERKIYDAFKLISGPDLYSASTGVTLQLNCKIPTLSTLADLLDPRQLFPNSYASLTVPQYRTDTPTSKTYYFIYANGGVNQQVNSLGGQLSNDLAAIIPADIATACGAFSITMQQVKNIMQIDVERLALSVVDLELTNKGLGSVNNETGTAVNIPVINSLLSGVALGSGNTNTFRQCDFLGAASGYPYDQWLSGIQDTMNRLPTSLLQQKYKTLYTLSLTPVAPIPDPPPDPLPGPFDSVLDAAIVSLIGQIQSEISNIYSSNTDLCNQLSYYWNQIGNQLFIEQRAIPLAIPRTTDITDSVQQSNFQTFIKDLETYAKDNGPGESAQTLERISDTANLGGQSIIAAMREARNAERLNWAGIPPDSGIPGEVDLCAASAVASLNTDGSIDIITMTNKSLGYDIGNPPSVDIYPYGYGGQLIPVIEEDGSISNLFVENPGIGYPYIEVSIESPPNCQIPDRTGNKQAPQNLTGNPNNDLSNVVTFPGPGPFTTFSENPYLPGPIPPLPPPDTASPTVDEAIADVTICNCDCWNL
jgi:hypothetical protein